MSPQFSIFNEDLRAQILASKKAKALVSYVLNDYQVGTFSTSWTSYGITTTTEECLLGELFDELKAQGPEGGFDVITELAPIVYLLIELHITKSSDAAKLHMFLSDALQDAISCNLCEFGVELEDDEETVVA